MNIVNNMSDKKVPKVINIGKQNHYVYDIETKTHDLNCGFPLLVQNTDSFILIWIQNWWFFQCCLQRRIVIYSSLSRIKLRIPIMHCQFFIKISQNRDYIQTHCNDRRNPFHFA